MGFPTVPNPMEKLSKSQTLALITKQITVKEQLLISKWLSGLHRTAGRQGGGRNHLMREVLSFSCQS